eukprot:7062174-Prymnesium_polylepis.1
MMLKYIVGWAFAFAAEARLTEVKAEHLSLCAAPMEGTDEPPDCLGLELVWVGTLTAVSGL